MSRSRFFWLFFSIFLLFLPGFLFTQEQELSQFARRFQNGAQLYHLQRWQESVIEFRRAQEIASNRLDWSRAIYWVILSQLAATNYGSALIDMDELQRTAPNTTYARDMFYHRGRIFFNQGSFEDALVFFNHYLATTGDIDSETSDRRAAAFFWMGESLYAMGQLEEAEKFYAWVIGRYPQSPKIEAASYRIDLIKQKKIEAELLALLQWSHEESLRTSEDFQRTIRTYEHTLNAYQRRIAELVNQDSSANDYEMNEDPLRFNSFDTSPGDNQGQPVLPQNQRLLDRAREIGNNVEDILREQETGGR